MSDWRHRLGFFRHLFQFLYVDPTRVCFTVHWRVPANEKVTGAWAPRICKRFRIKFRPLADSPMIDAPRFLVICPHRCVADFFVHKYLVRGKAATLSRMVVGLVFPPTFITGCIDHGTWFFVRGRRRSRADFYRWLDRQFARCPLPGLIVYGEGHRNQTEEPLRLRTGMIYYAYERKLPVQVLMTARTEQILNEFDQSWHYDVEVPYRFEAPIDPKDFDSARSFYGAVRASFEASFRDVIGSDTERESESAT